MNRELALLEDYEPPELTKKDRYPLPLLDKILV
jgi:hypothetical protein